MFTSSKRRLGAAALGLSAALALAACSSGDSGDTAASEETAAEETAAEETEEATDEGTEEAPEEEAADDACVLPPGEIVVPSIDSMTGPAAFAGILAEKGADLAVSEINESGYLGEGVTLKIDVKDDTTAPDVAASEFSKLAADPNVAVVLGPVISAGGVQVSPLAEDAGLPIVYTQAGSPGVVIGDYTFRMTPPMDSYWPGVAPYVQDKGVKTIGVIYDNANATLIATAETAVPKVAEAAGAEIVESIGLPTDTTDYKAPVDKILAANPDAVATLTTGAANNTIVSLLADQGFTVENGKVLLGFAGIQNNLPEIGDAGYGVTYSSIFDLATENPDSIKFIEAYKEFHGEDPANYGAERYDAVYLIADGMLAACNATDRQAIRDGMAEVASQPRTGALGNFTFEAQDIRVEPFITFFDGEKQVVGTP